MLTSIGSSPVLKDFRGPALRVLDELLSALGRSILICCMYMNWYELVTWGKFKGPRG